MRVRQFGLRLVAAALVAGWATTAALVLFAYRPGGPLDLLVGATMAGPALIAAAGLAWPPVARGPRAFAGMVWLGIGALLCMIPAALSIVEQLRSGGAQTLLPSAEAAYPWLLALVATSLFAGLGIARRRDGSGAGRGRRLRDGALIGLSMTVLASSAFASVTLGNELAVRDRVAGGSRFGPTADRDPARCDAFMTVGLAARLQGELSGTVDGRPIGSVTLTGERAGSDFRWAAYVATDRRLGFAGVARVGPDAWWRDPGGGWSIAADRERVIPESLDLRVLSRALGREARATAEDHGVEVVEGARSRRCRLAVDGETFREAFPQVRWLVGEADLTHWRGELDYWMFLDSQLGQVVVTASGEAVGIEDGALQATILVRLTATERDQDRVVYPPG